MMPYTPIKFDDSYKMEDPIRYNNRKIFVKTKIRKYKKQEILLCYEGMLCKMHNIINTRYIES